MDFKKYLDKDYLMANKDKVIKIIAVMVIMIIAFAVFVIRDSGTDDMDISENDSAFVNEGENENASPAGTLMVDVSGAVKKPSVVELPANSRVQDAIDAAGGLKKDADITNVNRAAFVSDGEKILIPSKNPAGGSISSDGMSDGSSSGLSGGSSNGSATNSSQTSSSSGIVNGKVSLNSASSEELQTLTGIGPALATRIIEYREHNGSFKTIEDLKQVSGIGDKTFDKLKDFIVP